MNLFSQINSINSLRVIVACLRESIIFLFFEDQGPARQGGTKRVAVVAPLPGNSPEKPPLAGYFTENIF